VYLHTVARVLDLRVAQALAIGFVLGATPVSARASETHENVAGQRYRACERGWHWWCCAPDSTECTRPGPARLLLASVSGLAIATGLVSLFALGDRVAGDDPSALITAMGVVGGGAALIGTIAGRLGADRSSLPDRVRTETFALSSGLGGSSVYDENRPAWLTGSIAPTLRFAGGDSRLRLTAYLGGDLGKRVDTDPRPQFSDPASGGDGSAPAVFRSQTLRAGVGLDMAVGLPYPVLPPRRSAYLGKAELRWKPEFHYRRDRNEPGDDGERVVERTMLLPLTVGVRWHVSPRQRFTLYMGPRFDIVSYRGPGGESIARGSPEIGPIYGEAWYDIDIPLNAHPKQRPGPRKTAVNSQVSMGYIHSRFDGTGINFRSVVGFLGSAHVRYHLRVRPVGSKVAYQATLAARIGGGVGFWGAVGLVLPDLWAKGKGAR